MERKVPVAPGIHFGSQCPVNPTTTAIFDFLPRNLLRQVTNLEDFAKALVLDQLLGNTETRQAVFVRARSRSGNVSFRAWLIDHGMIFAGQQWAFQTVAGHGLYVDRAVYSLVDTPTICYAAVEAMRAL